MASLDGTQDVGDFGKVIDVGVADAKAQELFVKQHLLTLSVLEVGLLLPCVLRYPLENAMALPLVVLVRDAHPGKDVVEVGVCEGKAEEEEGLRRQITLERVDELRHADVIALIIVAGEDGFVRVFHVAVHLVEHDVPLGHCGWQLGGAVLGIDDFADALESLLDEAVVVRCPPSANRQARENTVVLGRLEVLRKFGDQQLVQAVPVGRIVVGVVLGEGDEVHFAVDVELKVICDGTQEVLPVDEPGAHRKARAGEDGKIPRLEFFGELVDKPALVPVHRCVLHGLARRLYGRKLCSARAFFRLHKRHSVARQ
ncbi:hypothetical protein P3W24_12305 [Luteibacter sp. PPL201]|uniref:Uncharacterized protein n=1 Tax=Luteibacter sahnii TaxID=3021977 RepID=A0ABT6BCJ3_9GAMM